MYNAGDNVAIFILKRPFDPLCGRIALRGYSGEFVTQKSSYKNVEDIVPQSEQDIAYISVLRDT